MFCSKCGKELEKNAKFCSKCGANLNKGENQILIKLKKIGKSLLSLFKTIGVSIVLFLKKLWKMFLALSLTLKGLVCILLISLIAIITFLIVGVSSLAWIISLIIFGIIIFLQFKLPKLNLIKVILLVVASFITTATVLVVGSKGDEPIVTTKTNINTNTSSIVSEGVNIDDLGNIVNGQFYFVEGDTAFYSTFDEAGETHVYSRNLKFGETKEIFNGFGWSFVVYKGWLYFSGNPGTAIDATYKLYRIKTDGTDLQLLNSNYTYNMHFYKEWIYYMRQADHDSEIAYIYRANLDGSNESEVIADTGYQSIIYENKLYYTDSEGYLNKAEVDGTNSSRIYPEAITHFVIGQGKILLVDSNSNIKIINPDGSNLTIIRNTDGSKISRINSYKNTVFYAKYGEYVDGRYGYNYSIYSINMNGTNDKLIYSSISSGIWFNIVDGKLYVLDYAQDFTTNKYIAIARNMNLDGSGVIDLNR